MLLSINFLHKFWGEHHRTDVLYTIKVNESLFKKANQVETTYNIISGTKVKLPILLFSRPCGKTFDSERIDLVKKPSRYSSFGIHSFSD